MICKTKKTCLFKCMYIRTVLIKENIFRLSHMGVPYKEYFLSYYDEEQKLHYK
jgi:hypothetical protein